MWWIVFKIIFFLPSIFQRDILSTVSFSSRQLSYWDKAVKSRQLTLHSIANTRRLFFYSLSFRRKSCIERHHASPFTGRRGDSCFFSAFCRFLSLLLSFFLSCYAVQPQSAPPLVLPAIRKREQIEKTAQRINIAENEYRGIKKPNISAPIPAPP